MKLKHVALTMMYVRRPTATTIFEKLPIRPSIDSCRIMVKFRRPSLADIAGYVSSSSYSLTTSQQPRDSSGGGEAFVVSADKQNFPEKFDDSAPAVGLDMAGHDTFIMGPKVVLLDSFIVDLLEVDTSAQTFSIKLLLNIDWDDDGTIEPEVKAKRGLGRKVKKNIVGGIPNNSDHQTTNDTYKTGKYVLRPEFSDHLTTWNPEVVLVNAICDESPVEAGSKFHSIQMIGGRPIISRSILYQPECRCDFSFSNFPFDEFDLELKFSSNKWTSEQVEFKWSERLQSICGSSSSSNKPNSLNKSNNLLKRVVDQNAIHGLSEFQITDVRVCTSEKDVNSMQRYDNSEGAFSQAHLIIRVRRDPYSYLLRVASVAELLMFLEVLSFLTDNGDLSARFSVSGTIFLAMVSLYGPMAEALPKVSVVTRVDKW